MHLLTNQYRPDAAGLGSSSLLFVSDPVEAMSRSVARLEFGWRQLASLSVLSGLDLAKIYDRTLEQVRHALLILHSWVDRMEASGLLRLVDLLTSIHCDSRLSVASGVLVPGNRSIDGDGFAVRDCIGHSPLHGAAGTHSPFCRSRDVVPPRSERQRLVAGFWHQLERIARSISEVGSLGLPLALVRPSAQWPQRAVFGICSALKVFLTSLRHALEQMSSLLKPFVRTQPHF